METESHEYEMGYDCGLNGANTNNCHFSLFSTPEKTKEWEAGKKNGENKKSGIIKKIKTTTFKIKGMKTKDIKDYLPFYLGCECYNSDFDTYFMLLGIRQWKNEMWVTGRNSEDVKWLSIKNTKPILRPLSDMTEEEKGKFITITHMEPVDIDCVVYHDSYFPDNDEKYLGTAHLTNILQWANGVNYLRSIFIDVDGLIESGIAIDKTTFK